MAHGCSCSTACGIRDQTVSPALADGFFPTEPPGKRRVCFFFFFNKFFFFSRMRERGSEWGGGETSPANNSCSCRVVIRSNL